MTITISKATRQLMTSFITKTYYILMLGMDVEGVSWHPTCSLNTNNGKMVAQNLVVGIVDSKPMWKFCTILCPQKKNKKTKNHCSLAYHDVPN
jgi:hypothetical protein